MSANQLALSFTLVQPFDPTSMAIAPSKDAVARETSALAAIENTSTSRRAKQCATILTLIRAAGEQGISDIEMHRATGYPRSSICARRGTRNACVRQLTAIRRAQRRRAEKAAA